MFVFRLLVILYRNGRHREKETQQTQIVKNGATKQDIIILTLRACPLHMMNVEDIRINFKRVRGEEGGTRGYETGNNKRRERLLWGRTMKERKFR